MNVSLPAIRRFERHGSPPAYGSRKETLEAIRADARRERLMDMELRLRPYRLGCFAILAIAMASVTAEIGLWWIVPLTVALGGFAVADRFMSHSAHPALWIATAWGILPLLLADAVVITGGAESPVVMWFALPAVTLGARFEPPGIAVGTAFILTLMLVSTVGYDPAAAADNHVELVAAVALVLSAVVLSGAVAESDRAHRRSSTLDPLTGLFNRNALDQRLSELHGQPVTTAEGSAYSLLLCDLDHFKAINDRHGHAAGDAVLQDVAYTMRGALRAGDSIYRVGGEEILVLLPGAGAVAALEIAERLRLAVRGRRPAGVGVTVSIGVANSLPGALDTDELVGLADAALYSAKAAGRDRVVVGAN